VECCGKGNAVSQVDTEMQFVLSIAKAAWFLIVAARPAIGPLAGVVIGAWLSRSWQKKQWALDSKKTEYRELISTLSQSVQCLAENLPSAVPGLGTLVSDEFIGIVPSTTLEPANVVVRVP
jgi:hypothetical protein